MQRWKDRWLISYEEFLQKLQHKLNLYNIDYEDIGYFCAEHNLYAEKMINIATHWEALKNG
jgi:hypothetical protein